MRANTEPMLDAQNTLAFGQDVNASGGRLPERAAIQYHRPCPDFNNRNIRQRLRRLYAALDEGLNLVGNMRNHLDGFAQIRAAPLLAQYRLVNLPGGEIVLAAHSGLHKAFIMAEI